MELSLGHKKGAPHDPKKGGGLFGQKKEEKSGPDFASVQEQVMTVTRRLRVLEEQQTNVRRKLQMVEQNMLSNNKKLNDGIKDVNADIVEVKRMVADMETKILMIIKELKETARKDDVSVLQKYINMWEPVNFVTRDELEKALEEALGSK